MGLIQSEFCLKSNLVDSLFHLYDNNEKEIFMKMLFSLIILLVSNSYAIETQPVKAESISPPFIQTAPSEGNTTRTVTNPQAKPLFCSLDRSKGCTTKKKSNN